MNMRIGFLVATAGYLDGTAATLAFLENVDEGLESRVQWPADSCSLGDDREVEVALRPQQRITRIGEATQRASENRAPKWRPSGPTLVPSVFAGQ